MIPEGSVYRLKGLSTTPAATPPEHPLTERSVVEDEALLEEVRCRPVIEPVIECRRSAGSHRELRQVTSPADVFHRVDEPRADSSAARLVVDNEFLNLCNVVARVHQAGN